MRLAGLGILHHLDIAVIGGEQHHAMGFLDRRAQLAQTFVDRVHRLHRRIHHAGMTHHVGIGVVGDDEIIFAAADRLHQFAR